MLLATAVVFEAATARQTFEFEGNQRLSDDRLRRVVAAAARAGDGDRLKTLQEAYIQEGHLSATIQLRKGGGDSTVVFVIDEGEPARFGRVRIFGSKNFADEKIRQVLNVGSGARFKPGTLNRNINALLTAYDRAGFPFAQVWMDSLQLDAGDQTVDLIMYIVEGEPKELARVEVQGLEKTRPDLAVKLSGLKPGSPYSGRDIRDAYVRLSNSGIFDDVAYPTIQLAPEGRGVEALIRVVESRRSNSFSAAFGYADREGAQDKVLSGMVRLNLLNIGGSLRDFNVLWRNDGQDRSETKLSFRQRFFLGRRLTFGLSLEQIGLDTLYTWQSLGIEAEVPVGRVAGGLVSVDAAVHGDRNTFSEGSVSKTLRYRVVAGLSVVRGREGTGTLLELRNRHAFAFKDVERRDATAGGSVSQYIVEAGVRLGSHLVQNIHLVNELQFKSLTSDEELVPLSEQFYIGGAATLRGYRENQFHGRRVGYTRSEILVGRSRKENAYLFADAGYILVETLSPSGIVQKDDSIKLGFGFGLRTQSRAGNIDISFGIGEKVALRQTKVHVILNRSF